MDLAGMTERERIEARGKKVMFTVVRDGVPVERYGVIERVAGPTVWISSYLYMIGELRNLREVG